MPSTLVAKIRDADLEHGLEIQSSWHLLEDMMDQLDGRFLPLFVEIARAGHHPEFVIDKERSPDGDVLFRVTLKDGGPRIGEESG